MHNLDVGEPRGNHFDWAYTGGPPTTGELETLAAAASGAYDSALVALLPAAWSVVEVTCQDLANPSTVSGVSSTSFAGTRAGTSALVSRSACLIYSPNRAYRGSRPKTFWPWGVDGDLGSGATWSTSFITEVHDAWSVFSADIDALSAGSVDLTEQVSVSYFSPPYTVVTSPTTGRARNVPTTRTTPLVTNVLAYHLSQVVGTQRRRLRS